MLEKRGKKEKGGKCTNWATVNHEIEGAQIVPDSERPARRREPPKLSCRERGTLSAQLLSRLSPTLSLSSDRETILANRQDTINIIIIITIITAVIIIVISAIIIFVAKIGEWAKMGAQMGAKFSGV